MDIDALREKLERIDELDRFLSSGKGANMILSMENSALDFSLSKKETELIWPTIAGWLERKIEILKKEIES